MISNSTKAQSNHALSTTLVSGLLLALLLITPYIQWQALFDAAGLPRYALIETGILLLGTIWALLVPKKQTAWYWHPVLLWLSVYTVWAILSVFWSVDPEGSIDALHHLLPYLLLLAVLLQTNNYSGLLHSVLTVSVIAGVGVAILGLSQILGFEPAGYVQSKPPAASFINRNHAAQYIDLITPLAFGLMLASTTTKRRWQFGFAFGVLLAYQINIFSRGSWLALFLSIATLCFLLYKNPILRGWFTPKFNQCRPQLILSILLVILFLTISNTAPRLDIENKLSMNSSVDIRLKSYANSLAVIADNPGTGVGYGAFMLGFRPYMFSLASLTEANENLYLVNLHNDFLQELVELGIFGGLMFLVFYFLLIKSAWNNLIRSDSPNIYYHLGILLALTAAGIHALVSFPLHRPTSSLMFWVLAGLTLIYTRSPIAISGKYRSAIKISLVVGFLVTGALTVQYYDVKISQDMELKSLKKSLVAKDCTKALLHADRLEYTTNYYSRILLPLAYNICRSESPKLILTKLTKILEYDPNNSIARVSRGMIYLDNNQTEKAVSDFLNVIQILPTQPTAYIGLGHAAIKNGNIKLAQELYTKALELDESNQTAKEMLDRIQKASPAAN